MRLTRQTNYAMRILMYCAVNNDRLSRIPEIAAPIRSPNSSCSRSCSRWSSMAWWRRCAAAMAASGSAGRRADITLFDVVRVTEESFAMAECFESDAAECPLIDSCSLNAALREALNAFFAVLERHTIAELVAGKTDMRGLLGIDLLPPRAALAELTLLRGLQQQAATLPPVPD